MTRGRRAAIAALFFAASAAVVPGARAGDVEAPAWFRQEVESFRARAGFPALAVGVAVADRPVVATVVGVRRHGDPGPARQEDRFHIGSITKPMSATLFARFVDQGFLRWDTTVEAMFPELAAAARPAYRRVSVAQLISHTSGMPYEPRTPESETDKRGRFPQQRRLGYVEAALRDPPVAPPGTKSVYGGGHVIVAHYVEQLMGEPYEALMQEHVFKPLGMRTARFGSPATPGTTDAPWEHVLEGGRPRPLPPDPAQSAQARSPVGRNLAMSIGDLTRFAAMHLAGARGRSTFLKPESFAFLHSPLPPLKVGTGWALGQVRWARGTVLWHSGSTGRNHALCHVVPEEDFAVCVATNISFDAAQQRLDEITELTARHIQARRLR